MNEKVEIMLDEQLLEKLEEKLKEYKMDINEYFGWLIRCDIERNSDKAPNFVGYLTPENVRLVDDCFRAERCINARKANINNSPKELQEKYLQANAKGNENIEVVKKIIGEAVLNELRHRVF